MWGAGAECAGAGGAGGAIGGGGAGGGSGDTAAGENDAGAKGDCATKKNIRIIPEHGPLIQSYSLVLLTSGGQSQYELTPMYAAAAAQLQGCSS